MALLGLGITNWPGITRTMPPMMPSARLRNGMRFGVGGLRGLASAGEYALDANGNIMIDPTSGVPIQSTDITSISDMLTKGLALLNSQQVFQLNLSRAQAGLQPINVPAPVVGLNIGGLSAPMLLLGLGALLLLMRR